MFTLILDETLKEMTVQGSRDFPFEIYYGGVSRFAEGYLDWHWHDYFEINFVTCGSLHYFIENKEYIVREGEAVFINAGRLHRGYSDEPEQMSCTVVFDRELFCGDDSSAWYTSGIKDFIQSDVNGFLLSEEIPWMKEVLEKLKRMYEKYREVEFASKLSVKGYLCMVFADILNHTVYTSRPNASDTEKRKRMRKLLAYISQNYMYAVTLEELAEVIGLSEAECSRFFSSQMKRTPFAYLNEYRIERSCELLANTDVPISDIALQTGFNSFSYYSKRFREMLHCTPSEYRRKIQGAIMDSGMEMG